MLETRRARRATCEKTVDCETMGSSFRATVLDISALGARLEGADLPEVGTVLRLAPASKGLIRSWLYASICWRRPGAVDEVGLRFLEPTFRILKSWVGGLAPVEVGPERRRTVRISTELHVEVKSDLFPEPLKGQSLDLSEEGIQVRLPRCLRQGQVVELALCLTWHLMEVAAQVVRHHHQERLRHQMRFLHLTQEDRQALRGFLASQLTS